MTPAEAGPVGERGARKKMEHAMTTTQLKAPSRLGPPLLAYVAVMVLVAGAVLAAAWSQAAGDATAERTGLFAFWLVLSLASECFWLETPTRAGMVSMSLAVNFASLYALPWHLVLTISAFSVCTADLILHRRGGLKATFNAAQTVVSLAAAIWTLRFLGGHGSATGSELFLRAPAATLAAPAVFVVVNTFAVAGAIALQRQQGLWTAWRENYGFAFHYLSSAVLLLLGLTLVISIETMGYISGLLYLVFFFFVRDAYLRRARERGTIAINPTGPSISTAISAATGK
jgi:hypothetical protein